jgi:hypothetical protein
MCAAAREGIHHSQQFFIHHSQQFFFVTAREGIHHSQQFFNSQQFATIFHRASSSATIFFEFRTKDASLTTCELAAEKFGGVCVYC